MINFWNDKRFIVNIMEQTISMKGDQFVEFFDWVLVENGPKQYQKMATLNCGWIILSN